MVVVTNPSMEALPAKRTWPPSCSHGTYQHEAIASRSRQLLMMGIRLPETCWTRREINNTKSDISLVFLIHTELRCTVNHTSDLHSNISTVLKLCYLRAAQRFGRNSAQRFSRRTARVSATRTVTVCVLPSKTHLYIDIVMKYQLHQGYMFRP